jgi:Zn ribbon nucleic-acid-binding protein
MKIVSNCPLCEEHSLHVIGDEGTMETQQCINCGYATTDKFMGTKEDNETFKTLPEEMQSWSKEANDRIWIPSMITLPFGALYPTNIDGEMKWAFAEMVDIPEGEQKNYPDESGGYFKQRYDTDNAKIYELFLEAMVEMNTRAKSDGPSKVSRIE